MYFEANQWIQSFVSPIYQTLHYLRDEADKKQLMLLTQMRAISLRGDFIDLTLALLQRYCQK